MCSKHGQIYDLWCEECGSDAITPSRTRVGSQRKTGEVRVRVTKVWSPDVTHNPMYHPALTWLGRDQITYDGLFSPYSFDELAAWYGNIQTSVWDSTKEAWTDWEDEMELEPEHEGDAPQKSVYRIEWSTSVRHFLYMQPDLVHPIREEDIDWMSSLTEPAEGRFVLVWNGNERFHHMLVHKLFSLEEIQKQSEERRQRGLRGVALILSTGNQLVASLSGKVESHSPGRVDGTERLSF